MISNAQPFLTARHGFLATDVDSPREESEGLLAEGGLFKEGDGLRGLFVEGDDLVDGGDGLLTDEGNLLAGEAALAAGEDAVLAEEDSLVEEDDESCAIDSSFSAEKVNRAAESADCFGSLRTLGFETDLKGVLD